MLYSKGEYLLKIFEISFKDFYHVGWRKIQNIIESLTIHRALISQLYEVYGSSISKNLLDEATEVKLSSLLPAIKHGDCFKIFIPFDHVPSKTKLSKLGVKWITLRAVAEFIKEIKECNNPPNLDIISRDADKKELFYQCDSEKRELKNIAVGKGFIYHVDEEAAIKNISADFFETKEFWRNRIDRLSSAADLYKVYVVKPKTSMILMAEGGSSRFMNNLLDQLKLLGELGLGGLRSYGLGRFSVSEADLCRDGLDYNKLIGWRSDGYYVSLGSFLDVNSLDLRRSIIRLGYLEGFSGPSYGAYHLPRIIYASAGSILYLKNQPKIFKYEIKGIDPSYVPVIVFNPIIIGG